MVDGWSEVACSLVVLDYSEAAPSAAPALARWLARSTMAKQGENEKRGAFALGGIIISSAVSQQRRREEGEYNLDSTHTLTCVEQVGKTVRRLVSQVGSAEVPYLSRRE